MYSFAHENLEFSCFEQTKLTVGTDTLAVNCTAYSNNGQLLVTGATDGYIRIYGMPRKFSH